MLEIAMHSNVSQQRELTVLERCYFGTARRYQLAKTHHTPHVW